MSNLGSPIAILVLMNVLVATACGPAVRPGAGPAPVEATGSDAQSRPLRVYMSNEPHPEITDNVAGRANFTVSMFGSPLVSLKDGYPWGVLGSAPELNTDTWKVFPDGRMETTFRLKPGLTWHDGAPLTAEDTVFSYQLLRARVELNLGVQINLAEFKAIEDVVAPASDTVVIRWRDLWVDAAIPSFRSLGPFPKHILGEALEKVAVDKAGLESHPYWTNGFVGSGPYRMTKWEPGVFIEGTAFADYVFGRPKIDKIVVMWSGDPNVIVTRFLAKESDFAPNLALRFTHAVTLRNQWAASGEGVVVLTPNQDRELIAQLRPDVVNPRAILDLRVRKASLHAIDRQALTDALTDGEGPVAMSLAQPTEVYHPDLLQVVPKYAFDPRRTEELMGQAGFAKGGDGFFASRAEGRFAPEVMGVAEGPDGEETTAVADYFRRAGIDAQLNLQAGSILNRSGEMKSTFQAWRDTYASTPEKFYGPQISTVDNQWRGLNKPGWLNPENDRIIERLATTLDITQRRQLFVQAHKNLMEDLPALPLYFALGVIAYSADLEGPTPPTPNTTAYMNLHEWHWIR